MEGDKELNASKRKKVLKEIREWTVAVVFAAILATAIRTYAITRVDVDGTSMATTLENKDVMFQEKISLYFHDIKRGNIITFNSRDEKQRPYIKRVIGLAGDQIELKNGRVFLNGKELKEGYLPQGTETYGGDFLKDNTIYTVPEGHIFVMGDNRKVSYDSRFFGAVKLSDIEGHVFVRAYPLNEFKVF